MEARQLLDNKLLQEAFSSIESEIVRQMYQVRLDDNEGHTRLVLALQTGRVVGKYLWSAVQEGNTAAQEMSLRGRRLD